MDMYHNITEALYDEMDLNEYMDEVEDFGEIEQRSEQEEREAMAAWEAEQDGE